MIFTRFKNTFGGYIITFFAFTVDFITLYFLSDILNSVYNEIISKKIILIFLICIFLRLFLIPLLKFVSLIIFFQHKKKLNETFLLNIIKKKRDNKLTEKEISKNKEILLNSSDLAVVNFDIPLSNIIGEIFIAIMAVVFIVYYGLITEFLEFYYLIFFFGLVFSIIIFLSRKYGKKNIDFMKNKISKIENIFKNLTNFSYSSSSDYLKKYFLDIETKHNLNTSKFITLNLTNNFFLESIIYTFLFIVVTQGIVIDNSSIIERSLVSLPFLVRLAPAFTRTMAYLTQLSYGYTALQNLYSNDN